MLSVIVNGTEQKMNIGCRTFVFLDEMLRLIGKSKGTVLLNGRAVSDQQLAKTVVSGGDTLEVR